MNDAASMLNVRVLSVSNSVFEVYAVSSSQLG